MLITSQFITNGHPSVVQVVPPSEYLKIEAIWNHSLSDIVNFFRFLRLASSLTENHVCFYIESGTFAHISLDSDKAGLLGVLQVVTMAFGDLTVDCLLDPGYFIYKFVSEFLHHFKGESILGIDDPDEQETIGLELVERDF